MVRGGRTTYASWSRQFFFFVLLVGPGWSVFGLRFLVGFCCEKFESAKKMTTTVFMAETFVYTTEGADVPEDVVRIRIDPPDISANAFQNQLGILRIE